MIPAFLLAIALLADGDHTWDAGRLPVCSNRVIRSVVVRSGCTLGDTRCWARRGGFCTDYVAKRVGKGIAQASQVAPDEVREGDVAVFSSRSHMSVVEKVLRDGRGRPVAVSLSEYNFGSCWVDRELMVTDQYGLLGRRAAVKLGEVDGGFIRPRAVADPKR